MPNPTPHPSELIGLPTVARLLGCSAQMARLYARGGHFQTWEIDGRLFARRQAVTAFKAHRDRKGHRETKPAA